MKRHGNNRIVVPQRQIQSGFDFKFESDPYDVTLHGLITQTQYTDIINTINDKLKPSRSGKFDGVLLATGPLIVPLCWWGIRHNNQTKRRKRLLKKAIEEFNTQNPELLMRWNRRPQSMLTIERKPPSEEEQYPQPQQYQYENDIAEGEGVMVNSMIVPPATQSATTARTSAASNAPRTSGSTPPDLLV